MACRMCSGSESQLPANAVRSAGILLRRSASQDFAAGWSLDYMLHLLTLSP